MTTSFSVTFNLPDVNVPDVLASWKAVYPMVNGETNANYVKRVMLIMGIQLYKTGKDLLNTAANTIPDPGITTS